MTVDINNRYDDMDVSAYLTEGSDLTQWYRAYDIPEYLRQGRMIHRRENSWDYSCVEEWDEYVPTDTESKIIDINKRVREQEARKTFFSVPEQVKDTIEGVIMNALDHEGYPIGHFDKYDLKDITTVVPDGLFGSFTIAVQTPTGPGGITNINSRMITGEGTHPNKIEQMKRKSMVDGLDIMYPAEAVAEYMRYVMDNPFLERQEKMREASEYFDVVPRVLQKTEMFVRAMVGYQGETEAQFSARHDPNDTRNMLDFNNSKVPDNMHDRNVAAIDAFLYHHPEYATALFLWQISLTDYSRDLKSYVREETGGNMQEILKELPAWDTVALIEGGNSEVKHFFLDYGERAPNIDRGNKILPLAGPNSFMFVAPVVSAVMGALLEESGITHENAAERDIDPKAYKSAFAKLEKSGMFQRGHKTNEDKPVMMRCPFQKKLGEMLTLDLGRNGKPEDQLLYKFVKKVRADLAAPENEWNKSKWINSLLLDHLSHRYNVGYKRHIGEPVPKTYKRSFV